MNVFLVSAGVDLLIDRSRHKSNNFIVGGFGNEELENRVDASLSHSHVKYLKGGLNVQLKLQRLIQEEMDDLK